MKFTRYVLIMFFACISLGIKAADVVLVNSTGENREIEHDKGAASVSAGDYVVLKDTKKISLKGKQLKDDLKKDAYVVNLFAQEKKDKTGSLITKYGFEFAEVKKQELDALNKALGENRGKLVEGIKLVDKKREDLVNKIKSEFGSKVSGVDNSYRDNIQTPIQALKDAFSKKFNQFEEKHFLKDLTMQAAGIKEKLNALPKTGAPPPPPPPPPPSKEEKTTRIVMEAGAVFKPKVVVPQIKVTAGALQEALKAMKKKKLAPPTPPARPKSAPPKARPTRPTTPKRRVTSRR